MNDGARRHGHGGSTPHGDGDDVHGGMVPSPSSPSRLKDVDLSKYTAANSHASNHHAHVMPRASSEAS